MANIESRSNPDLMNDPQYATNTGEGDEGMGDADTCRICRGEATESEPLFYPCKCSGSIKFVHQDCLMEWLSHSQKKHCELCKTPFRFTKLYAPNMPQTLPARVFARHLIIHAFKNITVWVRFCLVVFVWLGCLPWAMRNIWGFLFWFGDGGWTSANVSSPHDIPTTGILELAQEQLAHLIGNGTSPASPWLSLPTTSAKINLMANILPGLLGQFSSAIGVTTSGSITFDLQNSTSTGAFNNNITNTSQAIVHRLSVVADHQSLLSGVRFLKTLTRHPQLNNIIITTLEGQIITIVVVICFILVFLIREWVLQQQPGNNLGPGFNAELAGAERPPRNRDLQLDDQRDVELFPIDRIAADIADQQEAEGGRGGEAAGRAAGRPIARPRRRVARLEDGQGIDFELADQSERFQENSNSVAGRSREEMGGESNSRFRDERDMLAKFEISPTIQTRDVIDDGHSSETTDKSDVAEFVSLWRRADGNREEILRIIEAEYRGEKLHYWKSAMERGLQHSNSALTSSSSGRSPGAHNGSPASVTIRPSAEEILSRTDSPNTSGGSFSTTDHSASEASTRKGKEKFIGSASEVLLNPPESALPRAGILHLLEETSNEGVLSKRTYDSQGTISFPGNPGRLRPTSDGPEVQENISPLGSNNWSFPDLTRIPTSLTADATSSLVDQSLKTTPGLHLQQASTNDDATQSAPQPSSPAQGHLFTKSLNTATLDSTGPIEIYNVKKGTTQHFESLDEAFANNPVGSEGDPEESDSQEFAPERGRFNPEVVLPEVAPFIDAREPLPVLRREPQGLLENIADWLWGDMNTRHEGQIVDDEHVIQDIAAEAPFVPIPNHGHDMFDDDNSDAGGEADQDPQVLAAAFAAGIDPNDPDGLDEAEDFEGIMELVGMRGPLTSLFQNGVFSILLMSVTVACGAWVPYNVGRLVLWLLANPVVTVRLPLKLVFSCAAVIQDFTLVLLGSISFLFLKLCLLPSALYSYTADGPAISKMIMDPGIAWDCMRIAYTAGDRILHFLVALVRIPESEVPAFSAVSHESLIYIKAIISHIFRSIGATVIFLLANPTLESDFRNSVRDAATIFADVLGPINQVGQFIFTLPASLATAESWIITLDTPERSTPLDPNLSYWSGTDRFWAILAGYITFSLLGAAYLRKGPPFSTSQTGKEWEASIIDALHQAGGVMKVILIISIEMLVFPLYCGLLLDIALLPLFENATILSRVLFTIETPLTSVFVHWFVGTCYMFHFALFVSMCRKIMRSGVLYFIRDPDDPTFHPVRDVLERNVATQLRKIAFSAMVYGALVIVCLGGVVWSLALVSRDILPIHWSTNEPVLEFPIDLLFYNFLMPLAVKFFKPSDALHAMYSWWFRNCARMLRLSWFLFDERRKDEEGHFIRNGTLGFPGSVFGHPKVELNEDDETIANFVQDGKFVRAPASDQVRIPKGSMVFLEVTEHNDRVDGLPDPVDDLHGRNSQLFKMVYLPPNFKLRIFLFIFFIWIFAAVTGVAITIVPLVFGRHIFSRIIPPNVRKNDIYAFSIGIYILGSAIYCVWHAKEGFGYLRKSINIDPSTPIKVVRRSVSVGLRVLRVLYVYAAFTLVLPTLFALAVEFYFIVPLHTYFTVDEPHIIHFIQSWTLGLLYVKLTTQFILWNSGSRPAEALRAVTRSGYLDPDIRIATRAFIFPATTAFLAALFVPLALASVANHYCIFGADPVKQVIVYRYAYPLCLSFVLNVVAFWLLLSVMKGWRMRIRDEVYLIGERLHNFGDRSKNSMSPLIPRLET